MASDKRPVAINISGIPVAGVGGLGLVAMAVVVSVFLPAASWTMGAGLAGGVLLAMALVVFRRTWKGSGPSGDDPKILFRELPPEGGGHRVAPREPRASDRELMAAGSAG
jgi:hypothetical protein